MTFQNRESKKHYIIKALFHSMANPKVYLVEFPLLISKYLVSISFFAIAPILNPFFKKNTLLKIIITEHTIKSRVTQTLIN